MTPNTIIETPHASSATRRDFLKIGALAGAGLIVGAPHVLSSSLPAADAIKVGFIGLGKQHEVLFNAMKNIPGIHYAAVCDIMKNRLGSAFSRIRTTFGYEPERFIDAEEMLAKAKLDAVIVATPDFWHARHTIWSLESACAVYCEKMMADNIEGARSMVAAMERTGQLCQIGHQRRSNPRYLFVLDELLRKRRIFGQIVNANGQWNRAVGSSQDIQVKPSILPDKATLLKYGFGRANKDLTLEELQHRFLNWRFYKDLSGGPISDLGAHQIDVFNWFFGVSPSRVLASGGRNYFKDREHFDNVMCIFDYPTPDGGARAFYQVLTTTSAGGGYFESFMGIDGTVRISEREAYTAIYREAGTAAPWDDLVAKGVLKRAAAPAAPSGGGADAIAAYESAAPEAYDLPGGLSKPPHQPHLENFFSAIRGQAVLTCDARHALESEAPIYWVNPAAESGESLVFTKDHLRVI